MNFIYPAARIEDATETLAGISFPDPYRWLEENSDEVRLWQRAQARLATAHVREWPHFDRLQRMVERFNTERFLALPRYAAGRWFHTRIVDGGTQAQALVSAEPTGEGRVLFDPRAENPERPPFLSWIAASPDGNTLAVGICPDGSENNTIRLIDVPTGRLLIDPPPQTLMDNWTGGVSWLPDSSGFFFSALEGAATDFTQCVFLHRRTPQPSTVLCHIPWITPKDYRVVIVSHDGQHAVALERLRSTIPVAVAELTKGSLKWKPFVTSIAGTLAGHLIGRQYFAVTDVGASRGRLVVVDLDADDPNDPESWRELIGATDAVLRTVTPVGQTLYLTEFVDTYARIRKVDLNGKSLGEVPLPERGAVLRSFPQQSRIPFPNGHPEKFLFGFSSLAVSPAV